MDTSANAITTMGLLSNLVYNDNAEGINYFQQGYTFTANGTTYEVIAHTDDSSLSGFQALLLKSGNQYVIAFRGTELTSPSDIITDILAGTANINLQYDNALEFVNSFLGQTYNGVTVTKDNLTLTGHSLGGILTQQVGASLGIQGYAYNPWGADALTKYPPNGQLNIVARVLEAVGIYTSSAEVFAKNNIANISYQDGGDLNGDFLSNALTGLISQHLGDAFIPVWGADIGANGHRMPILNSAIAHYNEVLTHFSNSNYEELSLAYLSKGSFEKTEAIFNELGVYQASGLSFTFLTETQALNIANQAKTNTATLYALVNLNPFTVQGDLEVYKTINPDDYTEQYLEDRVNYLYYLLDKENRYDIDPRHSMNYYEDVELGEEYALKQSFSKSKIVFGGDSDNTLMGSDGSDRLYAGKGDDTLEAGKGIN